MRARLLKPGFFKNDELASLPPLGRILFSGLWCLADRAGRLDDRPARIKAEVLPYDECDVDALLARLAASGFIQRYTVQGNRYIQISKFQEHQSPHVREPDSTIPAPDEHQSSTVLAPDKHDAEPVGAPVQPSGNPIPVTGNPIPESETVTGVRARANGAAAPVPLPTAPVHSEEKMDDDDGMALDGQETGNQPKEPAPADAEEVPAQPPRRARAKEHPQPSPDGYAFLERYCSLTADQFTGDRRRREAIYADKLLAKARSPTEGEQYLAFRAARGMKPSLRFAADDYLPNWRESLNGAHRNGVSQGHERPGNGRRDTGGDAGGAEAAQDADWKRVQRSRRAGQERYRAEHPEVFDLDRLLPDLRGGERAALPDVPHGPEAGEARLDAPGSH